MGARADAAQGRSSLLLFSPPAPLPHPHPFTLPVLSNVRPSSASCSLSCLLLFHRVQEWDLTGIACAERCPFRTALVARLFQPNHHTSLPHSTLPPTFPTQLNHGRYQEVRSQGRRQGLYPPVLHRHDQGSFSTTLPICPTMSRKAPGHEWTLPPSSHQCWLSTTPPSTHPLQLVPLSMPPQAPLCPSLTALGAEGRTGQPRA